MAKTARTDEKPPPRDDGAAKIDKEVLRLAKIVAEYRGIYLAEYLTERLRPLVEADHEEEVEAEKQRKKSRRIPLPPPHTSRKSPAPAGEQ